jgi:hypothetical protein
MNQIGRLYPLRDSEHLKKSQVVIVGVGLLRIRATTSSGSYLLFISEYTIISSRALKSKLPIYPTYPRFLTNQKYTDIKNI